MVRIKLDGRPVYGLIAADGVGVRVRVSADEFEQLGLAPGRQVRLGAGEHSGTYLLTAADQVPPLVWLRLSPLSGQVAG